MSENNKSWSLPLIISISVTAGMILGYYYYRNTNTVSAEVSGKIPAVLNYIDKFYVDTVSVARLTEEAIPEILKNLDPHSVYMPAEDAERENEPLEGGFSGIGVQFNMMNDTVIIITPVANGPSARLGIRPGDRIVKVNGQIVAGVKMKSDSVVKRLKGPRGTKVKVSILRPGVANLLDYTITRDNIPLYSVDIAYMVNPTIGFIKLNQFGRTSFNEFVEAISKLRSQGMKKLILDLRSNGGGYMDVAIQLADQFLEENKLIVYTQGRSKKKDEIAYSTAQGICEKEDIAVLIDEYSASASEILAGAIQDNDRGIIIGRRSFGKGLVQRPITLNDGSMIRITIARYYTPTGRCIQKPYDKGEEEYMLDLVHRYEKGEFASKDSIHLNDSLKFVTPKGKVVYGGGGIMPDIFVPMSKEGMTPFYLKVRNNGLIYNFAFDYVDRNRSKLEGLKDAASISDYLEKQNIYKEFLAYLSKKSINADKKESVKSKHILNTELKAYIARNLIDNQGFYPIIQDIDATLIKAIDTLSK